MVKQPSCFYIVFEEFFYKTDKHVNRHIDIQLRNCGVIEERNRYIQNINVLLSLDCITFANNKVARTDCLV